MKYLFILFLFLAACYPTFQRERAKALLQAHYSKVELTEYYEYPNCSTAHTFATAWQANDQVGQRVSGVLCCDSDGHCLIFEKVR